MKLLILTFGDRQSASTRYRVLNFLPLLKRDFNSLNIVYYTGLTRPFKQLHKLVYILRALLASRKTDSILVQKILLPTWLLRFLKSQKATLTFDFDDSIWLGAPDQTSGSSSRKNAENKFQATLRTADRIISGNEFLAEHARQYSKRVTVIPSVVDIKRYVISPKKESNRICIGWIGSAVNYPYLKDLESVFKRLSEKYGQRLFLKIISNGNFHLNVGLECQNISWSEAGEINEMKQFDIGLMPLKDTEWSRGKCSFKAIQYMALGIVPVVSPVGANKLVVTNNQDGLWAVSDTEWVDAISYLIENPEKRRQMGVAARSKIHKNYTLETAYPLLKQVLTETLL
ncbi:MAG: glycosyltransferase family 4 protein [bacterium]